MPGSEMAQCAIIAVPKIQTPERGTGYCRSCLCHHQANSCNGLGVVTDTTTLTTNTSFSFSIVMADPSSMVKPKADSTAAVSSDSAAGTSLSFAQAIEQTTAEAEVSVHGTSSQVKCLSSRTADFSRTYSLPPSGEILP